MGARVNTAIWMESSQRWRIDVQKDGVRRSFYSSKPGRNGQREANRKADAWLDDGIEDQRMKVGTAYLKFLEGKRQTTSRSNWAPMMSRWNNHISSVIARKQVSALTEQDLQDVLDRAYARSKLSRKTLICLRADLCSFLKYCRKAKLTTMFPEDLTIPTAAARGERTVLQPRDFVVLFNSDRTRYYGKVVRDDMIHAYRLAVLTGLRPGELRGLRWQDVKRDRLELHQSTNCYNEITDGKNQNARRCVELSDLARMELEGQRRESGKVTRGTLVFDIPTAKQFEQHLARYCEYNNIPVCTPYELRHTFVSIAKVLPAGLVKSLVGHSEDMDTFGVYGHELNGDAQQQANALNSIFSRLLAHG